MELQEFHEMYVKQMEKARQSIFVEMCNEIGQGYDHRFVAARYLTAKRSITKEKLSEWVETVSHILDMFCLPWLQKAAPLAEEVRNLKSENQALKTENSSYQKRIISLQNQLIEKQEEQLNSVKSTVETELKTYSAAVKSTVQSQMMSYSKALTKSCSTALAPKKLHAAVQKVAQKEERSKNVMIYGLKEKSDDDHELVSRVESVLSEVGEKPVIKDCCRIGLKKENSVRPVRFSLNSSAHVIQVLKNARKLRNVDGYGSIYICPDRSPEERKAYKKLVEELKQKRDTECDKVHYISHNKIVSTPKNSSPV